MTTKEEYQKLLDKIEDQDMEIKRLNKVMKKSLEYLRDIIGSSYNAMSELE